MMFDRNLDRLELMLEMIDHLNRRLRDTTLMHLITDRDELDLSAYRLAVIGEAANKLTPELKARHAHIAWSAMYTMRNIIIHDYASVDASRIWQTFQHDLAPLADVCREELGRAA